jgi:hypothetical protein
VLERPQKERKDVSAAAGGAAEKGAGERPATLGRIPLIALTSASGLLVCAVAQALSRATLAPPGLIYWIGLLLIVAPIFWRLASPEPSSGERLTLVSLLGLALYGVKVVRDSFVFGYSDEPVHAFNAELIAESHQLFGDNPILPVTANYPGLEGVTSALMTMSGLSSFSAGLIVVGAARLTMVMALFFLFRRISNSARVAGLAVAIYVGNFNFLYFSAQYSYESLALPLLVVVLMALAERSAASRGEVAKWTVPIALLTAAIVVTHHLTSFALLVTLIALAVLYRVFRARAPGPSPWRFAAFALGLTLIWLTVVASNTVGYLTPVLGDAITEAVDTVTGNTEPRALFEASESTSVPDSTPLLARVVAFASILILFAAAAFGLRQVWRRHRHNPFAVLFCVAAGGFFATLALRVVPAAWETGNRASGFFFIGLAFVVTYALFERRIQRMSPPLRRGLLTAALSVICIGGVIAGWPWDTHLAKPTRASAEGRDIESEPLGLGRWAGMHLPEARFAAPAADARQLLERGMVYAQAGRDPGIEEILAEPELAGWHLPTLRDERLEFVVADSRERGEDGLRGYVFTVRPPAGTPDALRPPSSALKFEQLYATARVYDSGRLVVYDLRSRR